MANSEAKRQHTLPRFLLQGFASRSTNDEHMSFVFRADRPPFETNIKNISVERFFYGKDDDTLEIPLSKHEARIAPVIQRLLSSTEVGQEEAAELSRFVAVLAARSRPMRLAVGDVLELGIEKVFARLDPNSLRLMARNRVHQDPAYAENLARRCWGLPIGAPLPPEIKIAVRRFILKMLEGDFPQATEQFIEHAKAQLREVANRASIGELHVRALAELQEGDSTSTRFLDWCWRTRVDDDGNFVLGDLGPIAISEIGTLGSPATLGRDVRAILLPLSPRVALIGSRKLDEQVPSAEELAVATAELSREYFISARNTPRELSLQRRVGIRSQLIPTHEMDTIVDELLRPPSENRSAPN